MLGAVKTAFGIQVDGKRGPGRLKMTWRQLTERDCSEWKLSCVRSAMRAASQLPGRQPTDVDIAVYVHKNPMMMMMMTETGFDL